MDNFRLKAVLTVDNGDGISEENQFILTYAVRLVDIDENVAIRQDKDLKIYYKEDAKIQYRYEIETKDVQVSLAEAVKKSEDFIRRLFYRLDWVQICVEASGNVLSIGKIADMREAWKEIKESILTHYKGKVVVKRLEKIDNEFADGKALIFSRKQYLHFGLLFPCIPKKHYNDWSRVREVGFSEYENEMFEEHLAYSGKSNEIRNYYITGKTLPGSKTELLEFTGEIKTPENELFPASANVNFICNIGKINIKWHINLEKIINKQ